MSIEIGNRLSRAGRIAESLSEYRKVPSKSPLFEQAQFNIKALESRLLNSGQEYDGEQFLEKSETKFLRVFNNECDNNWVDRLRAAAQPHTGCPRCICGELS